MIRIYKLKYTDRQTAIADLKAKGVYTEDLSFGNGIHAVVEVGLIINEEATFDEQGNLLTQPTYREGYHFDIMSDNEIDFGDKEIFPNSPKHTFAGYEERLIEFTKNWKHRSLLHIVVRFKQRLF